MLGYVGLLRNSRQSGREADLGVNAAFGAAAARTGDPSIRQDAASADSTRGSGPSKSACLRLEGQTRIHRRQRLKRSCHSSVGAVGEPGAVQTASFCQDGQGTPGHELPSDRMDAQIRGAPCPLRPLGRLPQTAIDQGLVSRAALQPGHVLVFGSPAPKQAAVDQY